LNKYEATDGLVCDIVTHPDYYPRLWVRLPLVPAFKNFNVKANTNDFTSIDGSVHRLVLSTPKLDMSFDIDVIDSETKAVLEEIEKRGVPVQIYSHNAGSRLFSASLEDTIPEGSMLSITADVCTPYILKSDAGHGYKLVSASNEDNYSAGVPVGISEIADFILQRGMVFQCAVNNLIDNSILDGDTNWTFSDDNVCEVIDGSWLNDDFGTILITNDDDYATSATFATNDDENYAVVVCGYQSSGQIKIQITWDGGDVTVANHAKGTGLINETVEVPSNTNCRLKLICQDGDFACFTAPAVLQGKSVILSMESAVLIPYANAVENFTCGAYLKIEDLHLQQYDSEGLCVVSCYCQPAGGFGQESESTVLYLKNNNVSGVGYRMSFMNNHGDYGISFQVESDQDSEEITHTAGDIWFVAIAYGHNTTAHPDTVIRRMYAKNITTGTLHTINSTNTTRYLTNDTMYIGSQTGENTFCGLIGGVSAQTVPVSDITDYISYMTDENIIDIFRNTIGRAFYLSTKLKPTPWERKKYDGSIDLKQCGIE